MRDLQCVPNVLGIVEDVGDVARMCQSGRVGEGETGFFFDADAVVGGRGGVAERVLPRLEVVELGDGGADGDVLAGMVGGEGFVIYGL